VRTVGNMEKHFGDGAVVASVLVDCALANANQSVDLETVEGGTFEQSGGTSVFRPIGPTAFARARYHALVQSVPSGYGRRRSTISRAPSNRDSIYE
jgi:hypothetical protein